MKKRKNKLVVEIDRPLEETTAAISIITAMLEKNNISLDLSIAYDYECEGLGMYIPNEKGQESRIFVNPSKCKTQLETFLIEDDCPEPYCSGYTSDFTLFGVTIHEFCHLLQFKVFKDIIPEFGKAFPYDRLYLNDYSNNGYLDELAEIMSLYLTNPYLLNLISKPHFEFLKKFFKSPVSCSLSKSSEIFNRFPIHVKKDLEKRWGIVFNIDTEKFEKRQPNNEKNKKSSK